jgi:LmbE family N-acetylglucosaminyl deacetylase
MTVASTARKLKKAVKSAATSAYFHMMPARMRSTLRLWTYLDWPDRTPRPLEEFGPEPVLVLAPHMDDEVIGPGGTLRRHVEAGAKVTVVFLTDGRLGAYNDGTLVQRRKQESLRAADLMGFDELAFLDGPDGKLSDEPRLVARVARLLAETKPAVVYAPAVTDGHADHWGANRVLYAALNFAGLSGELSSNLLIRGYEVWTALPANLLCDISAQADLKRRAIELFTSQTRIDNYVRTTMGLNRYRSATLNHGRGFAEAFMEATVAEYRQLFSAVRLRHRDRPPAEEGTRHAI